MSNDAQGNLSCDNQLMCIEAGINPDLFKHCTKCDTMTLEDCNSSDVDIICYNNFALSTVCQEKCWTWQEDNLPSFCTRYTKWNEYNTCYTEGLNADGCDKWMMDSYCINQDCVDWDCVGNLEDVPEKCVDKNCLSRNCYNECQEYRACNNETCRQMDNYNSYCNPCSIYGLDSIQCLSDNKYMDEYCAENGIICDNYCKNYNRFKPYAVNTVCEHPYCSDVCDSCLQGLDKDGCDANEFCYRGGLLNGDLYFGYCENECNSYLNILCNNNIEVCYRFNSSPCSYRICEQDQCTIKKYNSLITKYSYSIMSVSGMKLGYNIHYISDIPTDLQILRSDTDIDIFNGQINEWIIRVKSNRVSLLSTLFPSHGLNIRGKLSLAGYTTNEIDENSTNQLEFIGVEGEGLFLIRIPDTNLFLGIGDVYSFREIDNMDDFVWQIIENKHYDNVNVPMMYNPRDVLGYFRGATMKVEGYTMTFVGNVSGGSSKKYGGGLYMRGGRNTYWGPNKHITKRYTNDTMEAWTGCLITYDTQYYITADEEAIRLGIVEMDDKDKFAENIYYFLFYSDQKVFSLVSFYDVDGYHRYLGGLDKAEWITNGEPWRLTFNDDAIFGRNVVFSKDLVYLYYPFNLLYMNYDKDNDIPGGCSNPPEGLEYDSEPAPSDVPRMNFGKKKALIELNGENITHPAPEKFTMRMVDSDLYVGLGGDGHLITFCETEYKWLQMTTDTNQMWNMTGEYPWKYNNRQGFIINNQQMGVCQHIYCCDLNVTLDTDNEVIYIQPSLVDPDQPPLCSELPLVVGGESFEFVFVDATNYDL
jgi:hypothetical protein